jgi:threonine dehydrogenase-like Zn-dependent dehydrogenase
MEGEPMPRELVATAPRTPGYRDYTLPALKPNEIQVRSLFGAFKHGTELISYRGECPFSHSDFDPEWQMFVRADHPPARFPRGLGNMIVGEVVATGHDVKRFRVGDRVTSHSSIREVCVWAESNARLVPPGMSWQSAVCVDPLTFALGAVRDGQVRLGDRVAIFGLGAIGLMLVQCARMQGAEQVIAVDPIPVRRDLARAYGAAEVLDPTKTDAGAEIRRLTGRKGVDVAFDVSGSYRALHHAIRGVAFGGNVVAVAYPKECTGGLDLGQEAHFNRPNLLFARACSDPNRDHPRWDWHRIEDTSWRMLVDGTVTADDMLHPIVPFEEAAEAWRQVDLAPEHSIKLGVRF